MCVCGSGRFSYNTTRAYNQAIVAKINEGAAHVLKPVASQLIECGADCAGTDNAFYINQGSNIAWFADTMLAAVKNLPREAAS